MKKKLLLCLLAMMALSASAQSSDIRQRAQQRLNAFFSSYVVPSASGVATASLQKLSVDDNARQVTVVASSSFARQQFDEKTVKRIYKSVRKALPKPLNKYDIKVMVNGMPIEYLIPGYQLADSEGTALWGKIDYKGEQWVSQANAGKDITAGLAGRHIALWSSHGRYYNLSKHQWQWQRPNLFGTTEDLFTQTIVIPFLIPMLEHAGAVVFTPRERDWQTAEYIVDPDGGLGKGQYQEFAGKTQWEDSGRPGFGAHSGNYADGENPFTGGHVRMAKVSKKADDAFVKWQPQFEQGGRYAVYVSYATLPKSVDDAHYTVFHKGVATEFHVNQRMGGSTWVYLGTFDFAAGSSVDNCVMLSNQSHAKGVVTADAVRFGGGMGNIEREGSVSGYPRTLEGARYYAQWAGAPYSVYGNKGSQDDYAEDINTRSNMVNWLAGGSVFNPSSPGKGVPIELSLAVHTDAGYSRTGNIIGSLAICTTDFNNGLLASGISRQSSKMFASQLLNNVLADLSVKYPAWQTRYLWDRNYSETRLPEVPSAILETMSHQNFHDMKLGQDPNFRFDLARSIYKTIARYVNGMHGHPTIIEPLSPLNIAVTMTRSGRAHLSWSPQYDSQEPSAVPTAYMVYTSIGSLDFDNGTRVDGTSFDIDLQPGMQYNFRVTALNRGGESFPTEVVSAYYEPQARQTVLVVNGFHRLSTPKIIDDGTRQGFDLDEDIGVSYGLTAGWNGRQINFDASRGGKEGAGGLGYCGNELAGHFIAGNDFNYIMAHTEAIASANQYNVVSCTSKAVEAGKVKLSDYDGVDLILGLEKNAEGASVFYKTFTSKMQTLLADYLSQGGRLLTSGAYIGSDMTQTDEAEWLSRNLNISYGGQLKTDTLAGVQGLGQNFDFYRQLQPRHYAVQRADCLQPTGDAISAMAYSDGSSAAVAYNDGRRRTFTMGFPLECITDRQMMAKIMRGILDYLLK